MNLDKLFEAISVNQRKLIQTLLAHPEGMLSQELAQATAISNKSATLTPELRQLLEENGFELIIQRKCRNSRWILKKNERKLWISETSIEKIYDSLSLIQQACEEMKEHIETTMSDANR